MPSKKCRPASDANIVEVGPIITICRATRDGERGYLVSTEEISIFHSKLSIACRQVIETLGHATDRDVLVWEPNVGPPW